jgi:YidC/Oxa1 family membrane protein insertase
MDDRRRLIIAIVLMLGVAFLPSFFLSRNDQPVADRPSFDIPGDPPAERADTVADTLVERPPVVLENEIPAPTPVADTERTVVVRSDLYEYEFSSRGARFVRATLLNYESLAPGDDGPANIIPDSSAFLESALVFGNDTLHLGDWSFQPSLEVMDVTSENRELTWTGRRGQATVRLTYSFHPEEYLFRVRGELEGFPTDNPLLLVRIGPTLRSVEVDSTENFRSYGIVTRAGNTENLKFSSLDPGETTALPGPFDWIAIKSKYFVGSILALEGESGQPRFGGALAQAPPQTGRQTTKVRVTAAMAVRERSFRYSVYVGPQEYRRLSRIGYGLEDVNPYGWIFRPIIRPVSLVIVRMLLWGHENLNLAYGWLLVLFGVGIRILLWPLNQKAMRSQMAVQEVQPDVEALRKKYAKDQQKLGQETMKLYKERGINPLGGCLPMLLPMPILFAFFFVFLNTIELRGVPWMWLPDLSRPDPIYIIPLLMGGSMFAVTKMGQRGVPPNPQAKMMLYAMPVIFTVMFLNFSSGLNLYYTSQQLASIPQQWLISQRRMARLTRK